MSGASSSGWGHMEVVTDPTLLAALDDEYQDDDGNRIFPSEDTMTLPMISPNRDDVRVEGNRVIVLGHLPSCPYCDDDHNVYCQECGNAYLACTCPDEEDITEFYCMGCGEDFEWWYDSDELDDLENDIVDAVVVSDTFDDEPLECKCSPQKAFVCAPCGVQRDDEDGDWREFNTGEGLTKREIKCVCTPEAKYYCSTCKVRRKTPQSEWEDLAEHQKKQLDDAKAKSAAAKKTSTSTTTKKVCTCVPKPEYYCNKCKVSNKSYSSSTYSSGGYWYGKCRHYAETLTFPNGVKVNASSMNNTRGAKDPAPDFGLYCDWGWKPTWRNEMIVWPDFNLPTNQQMAAQQIVDAYDRAVDGEIVEVGCIGGHGRTGTALACMGVLAGLTPEESIKYVRKNYCFETLENAKQEWWVTWFEAYVHDKPLPRMPKAVASVSRGTTGFSSSSTTNAPHSLQDHYKKWNNKSKDCGKKDCKYWEQDCERFEKGDIPDYVRDGGTAPKSTSSSKPKIHYIYRDGYRLPEPRKGKDRQHTSKCAKADMSKWCDYCRYIEAGHGAFLEKREGPDKILIAQTDGTIQSVTVTSDFDPQPPSVPGAVEGARLEDYEWQLATWKDGKATITMRAWVWQRLLMVSKPEEKPLRVWIVSCKDPDDFSKVRMRHLRHEDSKAGHSACGHQFAHQTYSISQIPAERFDEKEPYCKNCVRMLDKMRVEWREQQIEERVKAAAKLEPKEEPKQTASEAFREAADKSWLLCDECGVAQGKHYDNSHSFFEPGSLRPVGSYCKVHGTSHCGITCGIATDASYATWITKEDPIDKIRRVFGGDDESDPMEQPDIDRSSNMPEQDLTNEQLNLLRLGLARLNYGMDDPSMIVMAEIRAMLWNDDGDEWTWDEVMGAASIDSDEWKEMLAEAADELPAGNSGVNCPHCNSRVYDHTPDTCKKKPVTVGELLAATDDPFAKPNVDPKEQEPEHLITVDQLRLVSIGLFRMNAKHPSTLEIRQVIREYDDDQWDALMQIAARQPADDEWYCKSCEGWTDHSVTGHNEWAEAEAAKSAEKPLRGMLMCDFCCIWTDHRTADCPKLQDAKLLAEEEEDEERERWGDKLHRAAKRLTGS